MLQEIPFCSLKFFSFLVAFRKPFSKASEWFYALNSFEENSMKSLYPMPRCKTCIQCSKRRGRK